MQSICKGMVLWNTAILKRDIQPMNAGKEGIRLYGQGDGKIENTAGAGDGS